MPRATSENTEQITLKVPKKWLKRADDLATVMAPHGIPISRTHVLRAALEIGIGALEAREGSQSAVRCNASGYRASGAKGR